MMNHLLKYLCLLLLLFVSPQFLCASEEWWEDEQEERIPITSRVIFGVRTRPLEAGEKDKFGISQHISALYIRAVDSDTPAASAGLKAGDILLTINGEFLNSPADLLFFLSKQQPGAQLHAVVSRNRQHIFCKATLQARPKPVVVGYARPVERTVDSVKKSLFNLQRQLAYHLSQCPHNQHKAQQCITELRSTMNANATAAIRLWYRDSQGSIHIDCYSSHFSIRAANQTCVLSAPLDELPPVLRARLLHIGSQD